MRRSFAVLTILLCLIAVSLAQSEVALGASQTNESQQAESNTGQTNPKPGGHQAAQQNKDWKVDKETLEVILAFFVLAVVFEMALAPIFDSSLFMARFEEKGIKTVITIVLALLVFWKYELDIFQKLLASMDMPAPATYWGKIMTALLIAGGSGGFHKILANLGVRMKTKERQERATELKTTLEEKRALAKLKSDA